MRRSTLLLIAAIAWCAAACALPPFKPAAPHRNAGEGLRAEVTRIGTITSQGPVVAIWAVVEGDPGAMLRRALLAPMKADPCREGIRATRLLVDDQFQWLRPVSVEGRHKLQLEFSQGAAYDLLTQIAAIDFVLASDEGDRCLRVQLTGVDPALAWTADVRGAAGGSLRAYTPLHSVGGVGAGWSIGSSLGVYAGPFRLQGEAAVGSANCRQQCLGSSFGFSWIPLGLSAHTYVLEAEGWGIDVGAGYRWIFSTVGGSGSSRQVWLSGPELTMRFAATPPRHPGLPAGSRIASAAFETFVADWRWNGPEGVERSLVFGVGLSWDAGF
jgi:hypothetical protein